MVHQHFMLVENMTVLDNVMLGGEGGFRLNANRKKVEAELREICQRYSLDVDPLDKIEDLSVGVQQRVEILKQIYRSANILILDEPTAVLTVQETQSLFDVLRLFKEQGKTIILITHKLQEILDITDEVTVMRAGTVVGSVHTRDTSKEQLAEMMVGRPIETQLPRAPYNPGKVVLDVQNLNLINSQQVSLLKDINFQIRAGEIVALAGVSGNGQSELLAALSGEDRRAAAEMLQLCGQNVGQRGPDARRALGQSFVPEERLGRGAVPEMSLTDNMLLSHHQPPFVQRGLIRAAATVAAASAILQRFKVKAPGPQALARSLSGGNLQKFILGREITRQPKVLVVAQPTWGVDVGAAAQIHEEIRQLRDQGCAVLVISEELDELFTLCDRLYVIAKGRMSPPVSTADVTREQIGLWMSGLWQQDQAQNGGQHV